MINISTMENNQSKASLLTIPAEVRNMIYNALMPSQVEFFSEKGCAKAPHLRFRKRCGPGQNHARPLSNVDNLTKVCKKFHEEVSEILLKRTSVVHLSRFREESHPVVHQPMLYKALTYAQVVFCDVSRIAELHDYGLPATCHTLVVLDMGDPNIDDIVAGGHVSLRSRIAFQLSRERHIEALTSMVDILEAVNARLLIQHRGKFCDLAQGQYVENPLLKYYERP